MAKTIHHEEGRAYLADDDHLIISQQHTFSQMIYHVLSEKEPSAEEAKLFELILNLSIDHGPDAPSAVATIKSASEEKTISEAISNGVEQINDSHGGAIEPAMRILYQLDESDISPADLVKQLVDAKVKLPGYGHRIYKVDPRAQLILDTAEKLGVGESYIKIARELEQELQQQTGKVLPINIDGAIAAVLCGFGWESRLGKAVFIIARVPGLCAHYLNSTAGSDS